MQHEHPNILTTSKLSGDSVRNAEGEDLGKVKDFMVDLGNGNIIYTVLSFGGFLGMGNKLFAVPWEALRVDTEDKNFVLDVDKEVLKNAPGFDKNDWPSSADRDFINRVHTHYGYEPYYTEEGSVRHRAPEGSARAARSG